MSDKLTISLETMVNINLALSREDAESMMRYELRDVVEQVLERAEQELSSFATLTAANREIICDYKLSPKWDHLPEDEFELTYTEEGLFPSDEVTDEDDIDVD